MFGTKEKSSLTVRQVVESVLVLMLAVILSRCFLIDNYMITTGSMAPGLLGFHKRVTCPACHFEFAFGVAEHDQSGNLLKNNSQSTKQRKAYATCPNCGKTGIDTLHVPRNHGDQLLVQKQVYELRQPHRFEVVVFRNPLKTWEAYVKRAVALPGEKVQVIHGDVHVGGEICRKKYLTQRALRIPVYHHDFEPQDDDNWQRRWQIISSEKNAGLPAWESVGQQFHLNDISTGQPAADDYAWVAYRHWVRRGGEHKTTITVDSTYGDIKIPDTMFQPIRYDAETRQLTCSGVLTTEWLVRLKELNEENEEFHALLDELEAASHIAPITDTYGYNKQRYKHPPQQVFDLMTSLEITILEGEGEFLLRMTDGRIVANCIIDSTTQELLLEVESDKQPGGQIVKRVKLPGFQYGKPFQLDMSLVDRQVCIGIDGTEIISPWKYPGGEPNKRKMHNPVQFAARGLHIAVAHLALDRDVHYTQGGSKNGVSEPYLLGNDEYYFLGDNSPISYDSRSWRDGAVNGNLFLGKPFIVHLPSQPGSFTIKNQKVNIRIPDFSQIRYIR